MIPSDNSRSARRCPENPLRFLRGKTLRHARTSGYHLGFTVPELAVVVAVIVCCLAVAAPSLLKQWEISRQAQCRERLKLLATGVIGHQEEKQRFPTGQTTRRFKSTTIGRYADPAEPRDSGSDPASGASWVVSILPYMDQKALYDAWDPKRSVLGNRSVAESELAVMYCPSRRTTAGLISACDRVADDWKHGGNDFAACSGSGISFYDEERQTWSLDEAQIEATSRRGFSPYSSSPMHQGVFGVNSRITRGDVESADGLAYVLILAERRVFRNNSPNERRSSDGWAWGGPATLFSTRFAPHTGEHYDETDSEHPGLINAALADARVRPISWNIDLATWRNLGNFAQGSPINHPEFRQ